MSRAPIRTPKDSLREQLALAADTIIRLRGYAEWLDEQNVFLCVSNQEAWDALARHQRDPRPWWRFWR